MKKAYLCFWVALVTILAIGVVNASAQVKPTGITKIINLVARDFRPPDLEIKPGDTVIWVAIDQPATVYFAEGTPVKLACVAPTRFRLNEDGAYTSGVIPPGGAASLCCVEPGTYQYVVFFRGGEGYFVAPRGTVPTGTITVRR